MPNERCVQVLCGMSKIYSLPGTRIGWLATHDSELLRRVGELKVCVRA